VILAGAAVEVVIAFAPIGRIFADIVDRIGVRRSKKCVVPQCASHGLRHRHSGDHRARSGSLDGSLLNRHPDPLDVLDGFLDWPGHAKQESLLPGRPQLRDRMRIATGPMDVEL
jgi:hypothetical protein